MTSNDGFRNVSAKELAIIQEGKKQLCPESQEQDQPVPYVSMVRVSYL